MENGQGACASSAFFTGWLREVLTEEETFGQRPEGSRGSEPWLCARKACQQEEVDGGKAEKWEYVYVLDSRNGEEQVWLEEGKQGGKWQEMRPKW